MSCHHAQREGDTRVWQSADGVHIDVRGLEPPEPMVAILRLIDETAPMDAIIVHLDREPIFLYPELDDRGWSHEIVPPCGDGCGTCDVTMRLVRWGA